MVKSLIETYRTIKEATNVFRAQAAGLGAASAAPKPVDARAQGFPARPAASPSTSGTSTAFGGRPPPSDAINNLGRVSQKSPAASTENPIVAGGTAPPKPRIFPQSNGPMGTQLGRVNRIAPTGQAAMANAQGVRNTARTNDIKTAVANYAQTPKGQSINARKGNDLNGPSSNRVAPAAQAAPSPNPIQAKPLGGSSSVGTSSVVPNAVPSQAKIDKSRSLQNANLKPGTNTTTASKPIVDLSKPGIGPGSQGDTGSKNTVAKSKSQAVSDTSSYAAQSQINKLKLDTSQAAQKPTTNVKIPMMDKAVADKTAADNAARVSAVRRPAPAPVRPGDKVSGEKVATNSELTGQAMAQKGFGDAAGGGNYPAARQKPPTQYSSTNGERGQARLDYMKQVQDKAKRDARVQAVSRPAAPAPRPGDKVPGEKVATNSELTGQAMAQKGFGDAAGGGNYPAARSAAPAMSPRLKAQMKGIIGGRYDVAPDKKPLAKPADQPYGMNIPTMSPRLKAQMDGKITDRKPAEVAAAEPNGENPAAGIPPKPTLKPTRTAPQTQTQTQTKKPGVVKKPNASAKPARKPQAAGTQNNMTPAQRAIINRRVERGNARPGEKTIGLGIKTGKVTGSTARSKRPIGSSQLKEGMLNNKQLAEMIKTLYKKKLEEQNPKAEASSYRDKQKFRPEHIPDNGNTSPNDYIHRMAEGMQRGNQPMNKRYTPESAETDLGSTDTGKKGREAETVSVNPTDNTASATGSMNKNTNTKEIKEKKNATMG